MITRLSQWLAKVVAEKAERTDVDYIRFGIEVLISTLSKLLFLILLSYFLDIFIELFLILMAFAIFRVFSGGVHMSTYLRCLTTSIIIFVTPAYLLKNTFINAIYLDIITFIIALLIIYFYVPVSPVNHPIPVEKNIFLKRTSYVLIIFWFSLVMYINFYMPTFNYIPLFTSIGILLQTFTLTPFGYKLLADIDLRINNEKKEVQAYEKSI